MMKRGKTAIVMTAFLACGCMSLDPFLFNGSECSSYEFDSYTGYRECDDYIDKAGLTPDSLIHEFSISSGDGAVAAVFVHTRATCDSTDTCLLYLHGRSNHLDQYWPRIRLAYDVSGGRYPVLAIDYRGFGKSAGEPTEEHIYEDGFSALRQLHDSLGNPAVIVYAYSLGSLIGGKVAAEDPYGRIRKVIFEAPIGSISTIVSDATYLGVPGSFVSTYTGDNRVNIAAVDLPYLWIHGTLDETLDRETNGQPVWDAYDGPDGAYVEVIDGTHITCPQVLSADYTVYKDIVRYFIQGEHRQQASLYDGFKP